ncbi:unnamed protein product [Adineta steineri]|uniref:Uncharacterized protein n=1 Tax=Adineta steineri TaxID=433720 RepID=A0A815B7C3_9BILA|nr:unnamed protein product [Adineta steineri]
MLCSACNTPRSKEHELQDGTHRDRVKLFTNKNDVLYFDCNPPCAYKYNIHRVRRQVVLIQRIVILILVLLVLGGPYSIFIILEALSIKRAPSYSHRIGFMFISIACASSIITIIYFTRSIRKMIIEFLSIKKKSLQRNELQRLNSIQNMELTPKRMPMSTTDDT